LELAEYSPDIVFLQECTPSETLPLLGHFLTRRINAFKGIALGSMNRDYQITELPVKVGAGGAVIAAAVTGPLSFTAMGIWSQGPAYVDDVIRTLRAHADLLRSTPSVVTGDFNSGTQLSDEPDPNRGHARIVDAFDELGLVSAYHAFHRVGHRKEAHPTYYHQFKAHQPWHIDFCFVPKDWADRLVSVRIVNDERQAGRSDHRPVLVEVGLEP
jgi:endonuclease/exonuclease/phosphatase family metal-dependent hydrolase